jgi:hypothetical protein
LDAVRCFNCCIFVTLFSVDGNKFEKRFLVYFGFYELKQPFLQFFVYYFLWWRRLVFSVDLNFNSHHLYKNHAQLLPHISSCKKNFISFDFIKISLLFLLEPITHFRYIECDLFYNFFISLLSSRYCFWTINSICFVRLIFF